MKKYLISLLLALLTIIMITAPVYAIPAPTVKNIPDVMVFRNLAETGDCLYVFEYIISDDAGIYNSTGNYSSTPASDSWLFRLWDGAELKATSKPYVYPYFNSNGYGMGVSSFYFGASDNASAWGSALRLELYGTPAYYSPAQTFSYTLTSDDYVTVTSQDDNRNEMYAFILLLADRLTTNYSAAGVVMKSSSDYGQVLSTYGEMYFRGAIDGLQSLCPALFFVQVYVPEAMTDNVTYNMTMASTYGTRLVGEDLGEGFTNLGDAVGVSGGVASFGVCFIACIGICIWTTKIGWGTEIGMLVSSLVGTFFALVVGNTLYTILIIIALLAAMGVVYIFVFKRA